MAGTFKFELVSPERILLAGDADQVMLSGSEGDMTVYAGHAPVITLLRPGVVEVQISGSKSRLYVKSGFAEIDAARVTVLAEQAFDMAEMDQGRVAAELAAAEAALEGAADDETRRLADRAVSELRALGGRA